MREGAELMSHDTFPQYTKHHPETIFTDAPVCQSVILPKNDQAAEAKTTVANDGIDLLI